MTANRTKPRLSLASLTAIFVVLAAASAAHAETYTGPVKELPTSQIGWEVNQTTKANHCLPATETCQPARASSEPGGFEIPQGVAVNNDKTSPAFGHLFVDDDARVVELEADGAFVSMFGWDVNKTKVLKGGVSQQQMNVCTDAEVKTGTECQQGVAGTAPGQFQFGESQKSIAVDSVSGDIYITDDVNPKGGVNGIRVQKFTAEGVWVLEIGKEVNETKDSTLGATAEEKDLCTQEEQTKGVKCTGPATYTFGEKEEPAANGTEPGVFPIGSPDVLAVGGPEDLLYVAGGMRVQEFSAGGSYKGEIPLAGTADQLALDDSCRLRELTEATTPTCASFDPAYGDLYVTYFLNESEPVRQVVHRLSPSGVSLAEFVLTPRSPNERLFLYQLAVDPNGRLAVSEREDKIGTTTLETTPFGVLLDGATGRLVTEFNVPRSGGPEPEPLIGLAFGVGDELYGVINEEEVIGYTPVPVAELVARSASCVPAAESESDAVFACALNGEVNPETVADTEASFQYGFSLALGEETPVQTLCTTTCAGMLEPLASAALQVRPNETLDYRLAGHDQNVKAPELLTSETTSLHTPLVAPRVLGEPAAPFVASFSAVLFGELNPENAPAEYFFEYGTALAGYCEGALRTGVQRSSVYGKVGATLEATGLQPASTYQYRLCASDQAGDATGEHGGEVQHGTFTTAPAPAPEAVTGAYSALTTSAATISGTVNPNGQPATYAFELGVYEGASTRYGIVLSGLAGAGTQPVEEALPLTGLQPATTYAYRIEVAGSYGATGTFTTAGLPGVLSIPTPLALLAIPNIAFPAALTPSNPATKALTSAQKYGRALKACKRKPKRQQAACERQARKQYTGSKRANNRKKG